jgi:uncharacterized protein GlcG (DUF336 family)
MNHAQTLAIIEKFTAAIERLVPEFMQNPDDAKIADGNVVLMIVDAAGHMYGKMFGEDPVRQREICKVAWQKALQVKMTGMATGRYEELVYSKQVEWWKYGIKKPDFVGWEGGLPVLLSDGTKLSVAFSGFRAETDCEIIRRAVAMLPEMSVATM